METTLNNPFDTAPPARPQFLKTLCILSFVACGIMILIYAIGTMCLALDPDAIAGVWDQVIQSNPKLEDVDPVVFVHDFGMVCFYCLLLTIVSLVGVIMMWRLEKAGFFIYAIAELSTNFFTIDMGQGKSYGSMAFGILVDLVFIGMYFANLKYMNKKGVSEPNNGF